MEVTTQTVYTIATENADIEVRVMPDGTYLVSSDANVPIFLTTDEMRTVWRGLATILAAEANRPYELPLESEPMKLGNNGEPLPNTDVEPQYPEER